VEFGGVMKDPWGNEKAGFAINGKINRKDWGLEWNSMLEGGGLLVSNDVWISCEVQLVKSNEDSDLTTSGKDAADVDQLSA